MIRDIKDTVRRSSIHITRNSRKKVLGRIMSSPQEMYILISETCEYVTLYDKSNFADVIKLRRW